MFARLDKGDGDGFWSWDMSDKQKPEYKALVRSLTNWQRTQWARAGYPESIEAVRKYAAMTRRAA